MERDGKSYCRSSLASLRSPATKYPRPKLFPFGYFHLNRGHLGSANFSRVRLGRGVAPIPDIPALRRSASNRPGSRCDHQSCSGQAKSRMDGGDNFSTWTSVLR